MKDASDIDIEAMRRRDKRQRYMRHAMRECFPKICSANIHALMLMIWRRAISDKSALMRAI